MSDLNVGESAPRTSVKGRKDAAVELAKPKLINEKGTPYLFQGYEAKDIDAERERWQKTISSLKEVLHNQSVISARYRIANDSLKAALAKAERELAASENHVQQLIGDLGKLHQTTQEAEQRIKNIETYLRKMASCNQRTTDYAISHRGY